MDGMRRRTLLAAIGGTVAASGATGAQLATGAAAQAAGGGDMEDAAQPSARRAGPHEEKIRKLLGRMTVEEKLGQLQQLTWNGDTGPGGGQNEEVERAARSGRVGSVLNLHGAAHTNALQRLAVEKSRLGIPLLFGLDVIHGFWTTFPIPLAQAASFDPAVAVRDAEVASVEARSNGVQWTFAPMMDVTHEPRWGRIAEGSGEDPHLAERFAAAKVTGHQGRADGTDLARADRIAACAKHFVAYGGAEGGRDYNTVDVSEARLRNLYLPPFKAAVDAGVATVMASFNTINGVPAHANPHTLTDVLKRAWDFPGFVVSDYTGVQEMITHGFAADTADAARLALTAGVDMEMVGTTIRDHGAKLLAAGDISQQRLDDAVTRILRVKFQLGLFDNPYVDEGAAVTAPTPAARKAAREVASRCLVLLRNERKTLPLRRDTASIAVVGPFGDSPDLHGTWAGPGGKKFRATTVLDGIRKAAPTARVSHAQGVPPEGGDTSGIKAATAAARAADVTVVVVGEPSAISGEASSRSQLGLPGAQAELIAAIAKVGKPFAVVVVGGRPLTMGDWLASAPAVVMAWHPGIEGGNAIADVLFGTVNPGGKLPASFPRAVGQIPIHYNHENTGRPYRADEKYTSKYLDLPPGPQFPFGHGLSYTTFEITPPRLGADRIGADALRAGDTVEVTTTVRNTGDRAGDEVVQLYVHDPVASITQPVRRLRGFRRVSLEPGQSRPVRFSLGADDLGFWTNDSAGRFVVEPGTVEVYVGGDSTARDKAVLRVT
ncbi:glycoside hydrolase family 3 N-terminal domain-containing protein [Streptomyces buecherae]|uniref:Exo-alpha-(1->6)-L-arabinopyranosidase n=1 Tax=Streptomyces buecherae TaxID=2763006 RepID=A0A7H8NI29_9ACTN|nr:glycoside hydrolase family 3 N-terminal domain-containing protein [Streptomyces buecherae]QKW54171.1 glycoside hydrolase family 3 C-terminal domain-containing protein [Streptomyces buecherae]